MIHAHHPSDDVSETLDGFPAGEERHLFDAAQLFQNPDPMLNVLPAGGEDILLGEDEQVLIDSTDDQRSDGPFRIRQALQVGGPGAAFRKPRASIDGVAQTAWKASSKTSSAVGAMATAV